MAKPTTFRFGQFLIEVGLGTSPETYGAPCGLTSKSFAGAAATNDTNVPDCDDPDKASWLERDVVSLARDITGEGVLAAEYLATWDAWFVSGNTKALRIKMGLSRTWTGLYILQSFDITADLGDKVKISVTLVSDGEIIGV